MIVFADTLIRLPSRPALAARQSAVRRTTRWASAGCAVLACIPAGALRLNLLRYIQQGLVQLALEVGLPCGPETRVLRSIGVFDVPPCVFAYSPDAIRAHVMTLHAVASAGIRDPVVIPHLLVLVDLPCDGSCGAVKGRKGIDLYIYGPTGTAR